MQFGQLKRREFISLLGGAAAWPLAAWAQQPDRMRRIGVLSGSAEDDPNGKAWIAALQEGLEKLGWREGRNVQIDYRFAGAIDNAQEFAKELVASQPDVIFVMSTPFAAELQRQTS
jgi:putative ABC transport system substrate-binding protein